MPKEKVFYPEEYPPIPLPEVGGEGGVGKTGNISPGGVLSPPQIPDQPMQIPNVSYELINATLNTQTQQILGTYTFGQMGAIRIGNYVSGTSGDINISPDGIVGRNSAGTITFSISGTTGSSTFLGEVLAGSVISTSIAANQITGQIVNAQIATIEWAKITSVTVTNADIVSINATKITAGDIATARMSANALTALQANITNLSSINADIGTITAGTITGVTITGGTVRTASSGARVQMSGTDNRFEVYNASALAGYIQTYSNNIGIIGGTTYQVVLSGANRVEIEQCSLRLNTGSNMDANNEDITNADRVTGSGGHIDFNESGRVQVSNSFDPSSGSTYALGGSTRYWQDVHTVNLTKYEGGSWGFFDRGVEMQDGRTVPDVQAILEMREDPSKTNSYGATIYDIDSLPSVMRVKPKSRETGEILQKDENGEYFEMEDYWDEKPVTILKDNGTVRTYIEKTKKKRKVIHKEGEDVFATISIMLGAIRELALRIEALEQA